MSDNRIMLTDQRGETPVVVGAYREGVDRPVVEVGVWPHDNEDDNDNILVVQIDTHTHTGHLRVYINDGIVYDGNPEES